MKWFSKDRLNSLVSKLNFLPAQKFPSALEKKTVPKKPVVGKRFQFGKAEENPIVGPKSESSWESLQTFNPAVLLENQKVHILYRAIGDDGISRIGYAMSENGIDIHDRSLEPVFTFYSKLKDSKGAHPYSNLQYTSGGSWHGTEDPRVTKFGDTVFMLFVAFDGWNLPRLAMTSIKLTDFLAKRWKWGGVKVISPPGVIDKSGCLFPKKIGGKYVIMHRIFPNILIDYVDSLDFKDGQYLKGQYSIKVRKGHWDSRKIGAGAPPIRTKYGWLLIYYGVDDKNDSQYKIGAMLLDLERPEKVLYRSDQPILEPIEWYENEGHKAGVIYPCGAVVIKGNLFVYYGGADTVVCVATANLKQFLGSLMKTKKARLSRLRFKKN
jgi:predicted GH43/DUF377 family glycosyl hydrolase